MKKDNRIKQAIEESIALKQSLLADNVLLEQIDKTIEAMVVALKNGAKVYWCGNGGSAADAQHLAAELSGRFYYDRPPLASEALHVNSSYVTAVANDYSYDVIFSRMIQAMGKAGDVLVGISTSGNSKNVFLAMQEAKKRGIKTVALTGKGGGAMAGVADLLLAVGSTDTPRVQESHIMIGHIICEGVEQRTFPRK